MATPARPAPDGFGAAFGAGRGIADSRYLHAQDAALSAGRLSLERREAITAFRTGRRFAADGLRVAYGDACTASGLPAPYTFLLDAAGRLLALNEWLILADGGVSLIKGIPMALVKEAGLPRRYRTMRRILRDPVQRRALADAGVLTREHLLDALSAQLDERTAKFVCATDPETFVDTDDIGERAGIKQAYQVSLDADDIGLLEHPDPVQRTNERPVALSDDGIYVRDRLLAAPE